MKKILSIYKPHMRRPIIYKTIVRFAAGLCLSLLWNRYLNVNKLFSITEYAFFAVGFVLLVMAWVNYLKLDGMRIHYMGENRKQKKKKNHSTSAMIDFTDESPGMPQNLSPDEISATSLAANLISGLCFILISLIF